MCNKKNFLIAMRALASCFFVLLGLAAGCDASLGKESGHGNGVAVNVPETHPGKKIFLEEKAVSVSASSELEPASGRYNITNAFDGDRSTAWCEGVAGDGVNESISLVFDQPRLVSSMTFFNGYQKSAAIYTANNRASQITLDFDNGAAGKFHAVQLDKVTAFQVHKFVSGVALSVEQVVRGSKYNDLCLSEIVIAFDDAVSKDSDCTELLYPKGMPWSYCVNNKKIDVVSLPNSSATDSHLSLSDVIREDVLFLRLEQETDFVDGKVLLFKLTAQYDYERDVFLHFVSSDGASLLLFKQASFGDDGGFEYAVVRENLNEDSLLDATFIGQCDYPDGCPEFIDTIQYVSSDNTYLAERVTK